MNASSETWQLGNQSVQVTHLEKVYWPQAGFTKGEVLYYDRQIAPVALPYLKDRPVTLRVHQAHPTVSTPLTWKELEEGGLHPADLTPQIVLERVGRLGDVFAPVLQGNQHIT